MKVDREDLGKMLFVGLLSSTPIAFMSFDFMYPNITTFSLAKNLLLVFAISVLAGMPCGYFIKRTNLAILTVIIYCAIGYSEGVLLYSAPYTIYNLENLFPSFYYAMFFRFTIILLFLFVLGGFVGTVLGQMVRESVRKEETKTAFPGKSGAKD